MRAKYPEIVRLIEARVRAGDYSVGTMPSERKIADEFGVGHMTARRAVQFLVQKGTLRRPASPRRAARPQRPARRQLQVSFVLPAFESSSLAAWYGAMNQMVRSRDGNLRMVAYTHGADPAIHRELQIDFDAMFIALPHEPSSLLLDALVRRRERVATLWHDYTRLGLVCVDVAPPHAPDRIVEHLASLGHRTIDCFNAEPLGSAVALRIEAWKPALEKRGLQGRLHNYPVQPFEQAGMAALEAMRRLLRERQVEATAIFCTSATPAVAVARACHEADLRVGKDISIATVGGMAITTISTPTITTVKPADFVTWLNRGLDVMLNGMPPDATSLHIMPETVELWIGESTGAAPRSKPRQGRKPGP